MNKQTEATARPWNAKGTAIGNKTTVVASMDWSADPENPQSDLPQTQQEAEANAALIVKSVNESEVLGEIAEAAKSAEVLIFNLERQISHNKYATDTLHVKIRLRENIAKLAALRATGKE